MEHYDILLGRLADGSYVSLPGTDHVALYARSGSGKTAGFTIPACFSWPGSLVVLDVKGEAFTATAGYRATVLEQDVYLLDPAAPDGRSHRWDPFAAVDRTSPERFQQVARISLLLFPEVQAAGQGSSNADKFWDPAGRMAFTAVAGLVAETPAMALTMATVLRIFTRGDGAEWLLAQIDRRRQAGRPYAQLIVDGVSDYLSGRILPKGEAMAKTDQVEGIRKTVSTRLQAWSNNPRVIAATEASDFDLRDLRRKPMTIYVAVAPGNIPTMRPFLRLFFNQLVNLNTDTTPIQDPGLTVPTLVLLDEFARLGRMDILAEAAQFVRGYGLRMAFVVQNKAQVVQLYGEAGATDIFDNVGAEVFFATTDHKLTKELEERLGDDTVIITTQNRPRWWSAWRWAKQGLSDHPHRRPLMLDQEIARMPRDEQIILRPGMVQPVRTKIMQWFTDQWFMDLPIQYPAPVVGTLHVDIPLDDGAIRLGRPEEATP